MIVHCAHCGQKNRVPAERLHEVAKCGKCSSAVTPLDSPMNIERVEDFEALIEGAKVPVFVDFWAGWCMPCKIAAPHVDQTAKAMAGEALVAKVDTEGLPSLAARYRVRGIPNFMVFKEGKDVLQKAGMVDHTIMMEWIREA